MKNKLHIILLSTILFSLLISSPPKWISDGSDSKYWVGIGVANIADSQPGEDVAMTAYLNAVQSLASQISISVESSVKMQIKENMEKSNSDRKNFYHRKIFEIK